MRKTFFSLFDGGIDIIRLLIGLIIGVALVGFLWGIVKFLFNSTNESAKKEGKAFMLYGIITLFIMTSFWGFVHLLRGSMTIETDNTNYANQIYQAEESYRRAQENKLQRQIGSGEVDMSQFEARDYASEISLAEQKFKQQQVQYLVERINRGELDLSQFELRNYTDEVYASEEEYRYAQAVELQRRIDAGEVNISQFETRNYAEDVYQSEEQFKKSQQR